MLARQIRTVYNTFSVDVFGTSIEESRTEIDSEARIYNEIILFPNAEAV